MNTIDLITALVALWAIWCGWRRGFVMQVLGLLGIFIAIWLAAQFGGRCGEMLHLDEAYSLAGGFAVVLVVALIGIGIISRLMRKLLKFVGFGGFDALLGIVISLAKYLLLLSIIYSTFHRLNRNFEWIRPQIEEESITFSPVQSFSKSLFPLVEWLGEKLPETSFELKEEFKKWNEAKEKKSASEQDAQQEQELQPKQDAQQESASPQETTSKTYQI